MRVHLNDAAHGGAAPAALAAVLAELARQSAPPEMVARLHVDLDWIQYKANFREAVTVRRRWDAAEPSRLQELAIDLRRTEGPTFAAQLERAVAGLLAPEDDDAGRTYLDGWKPLAESVIWRLNDLFWQNISAWLEVDDRGYESSLPGGVSDANHPDAIRASVAYFWTLLWELDTAGQLPREIIALEIGVGSGARAALWLDAFEALDREHGTSYYDRLRFLLGDYSMTTLERTMVAVGRHSSRVTVVPMDARDPLRTLSYQRFQVFYIHLTNVYDNLPSDELARRGDRLYRVEVRPYIASRAAERLGPDLPARFERLLAEGPAGDLPFWRESWSALRLEERLMPFEAAALPSGVELVDLAAVLRDAPGDVRFQLSNAAATSFANTLPLLHPRGFLQVQDIFVQHLDDHGTAFRGPGKLDGSIVNWVNGPLLRAIARRAGFHVSFSPFPYRQGSKTSILYAQRD